MHMRTPVSQRFKVIALVAGTVLALSAGMGHSGCGTRAAVAGEGLPARHATAAQPEGTGAKVNPLAQDRDVWIQLLRDHAKIRRTLVHTEKDGSGVVEATTESDDPVVAARIIDHAKAMQARMKTGARVRVWDPVFAELFKKHAEVVIEVTPTEKGVKIVESSRDPEAVALLRAHAMGVSAFVREGPAAGGLQTPRLVKGSALPPAEVALGGVPHRFLLMQPDAGQLAGLHEQGVEVIVNFRKPSEHSGYDEQAAAMGAGLEYCNLPYRENSELTEALFEEARAAIRDADQKGLAIALHCRSGNRVGPMWAAYRTLDAGVPLEQAMAEAKAIGLTDPAFESTTRDYIGRHMGSGPASGR